MSKKILTIVKVIFFIICVFLVILGQKTIGKPYLLMQLVGLAGLITLLWSYNKKFV